MALKKLEPQNPSDEIIDFLMSSPSPEAIIALRPSPQAQARLAYLLEASERGELTDSERGELDAAMQAEYFVRRLKIRAQEHLMNNK